LMEQHEVPMISFALILRTGSVADPIGKEGLSSLTISLLRKGTKTRTAQQIANELDFIGGTIGESTNDDYCSINAEFLKKDITKGLDIVSDILLNPTFPKVEINKMIKQRIDQIRAAKDEPSNVLDIYFASYLFGKHPYARSTDGDEKSLSSLTRQDVLKHYQTSYTPGNIILAIAGDFQTADVEQSIQKYLGTWIDREVPKIDVLQPEPAKGKRLLLVNKPDSTQTFYAIGNVGSWRTNPDRVYLRVINTLFGGRFTSMLNSELRINSGLTYGASSYFSNMKVRGPFQITSFTQNQTTEKALDLTLDILKRLHEKGVTEEELKSAKNYIKGQFPLQIETTSQLAFSIAEWEYYGLDATEVTGLYQKLDAMTLADAKRVIDQYFPKDDLVFVFIGKASEIANVVKKYSERVDRKEITDPGF
jgi:zinc protease